MEKKHILGVINFSKMKVLHLPVYFCFSFFLLSGAFMPKTAMSGNIYKRFNAVQCDSLVRANASNPDFIVLDVRTPGEWGGYHLSGSINLSTGSSTFDADLATLPKHKIYLLHCQSGSRSAGAFTKMKNLGFAEVYEMIGGISAWRNAGFQTTTVTGPKLMIVAVSKLNLKSAVNDSTLVTITNRANGTLTFSNLIISDEHPVITDFDKLKTLSGAQDYRFLIVHQAGFEDTTRVVLESNGGNISLAIGNSLYVHAETNGISALKLYPNPVSDRLFFDAGTEMIEEIHISDLTGKTLLQTAHEYNTGNIHVSELRTGIYIARIKLRKNIITRKFVVKR